jgi:hypothetical protein
MSLNLQKMKLLVGEDSEKLIKNLLQKVVMFLNVLCKRNLKFDIFENLRTHSSGSRSSFEKSHLSALKKGAQGSRHRSSRMKIKPVLANLKHLL